MARRRKQQIGKQPPRFNFFLNPYDDVRFTRCPKCDGKTKLRKLPLVIHVEPTYFLSLNMTCRYCPYCDLLIAHRDHLEGLLAGIFTERAPEAIGNDYLVIGTEDRKDWQHQMREAADLRGMLETLHDFKNVWTFELAPRWVPPN